MKSHGETAKSSTTDMIEGNAKIISGKIKEEAGKFVRSPKLEGKGIVEKNEGHVQKKIGEIKKVLAE
jgi:uncharacterized protein YjbJ (UPF0337 family)